MLQKAITILVTLVAGLENVQFKLQNVIIDYFVFIIIRNMKF